ncbi:MAG: HAD-IC family P-type ATPase, partial [Patescibacteria group bacterium]
GEDTDKFASEIEELDNLTDEQLRGCIQNLKIISRVSPDGKVRIAKTFKDLGETVAMTGDGLNAAPSLKEADIGIAMGSGSDVAKDVSDLVLLDDNFSTIVAAVEEGRRILENIRKVIIYLSSSVFGELILISASLLTGLVLPINALQILFINFITDSFPAIGLAFENHTDYLLEKRRRIATNLFDKEMLFLMLVIGVPTTILFFVLYWTLLTYGLDPVLVRTFIFAAFSTYTLFTIFAVRSLRKPVFTINPFSNPQLLITVVFGLGSVAATLYLPLFQDIFGTIPLPPIWLVGVAAVGIFNIAAIELGKFALRRLKMNGG